MPLAELFSVNEAVIAAWLIPIATVLAVWELAWKGVGLWHTARNRHLGWFIAIMVLNTAGILPIIYFVFFRQKKAGDTTDKPGKRVIAFGAFDPPNDGHKDFIRQAKALGDHLTVVVAHDSAVRAHKKREPRQPETERAAAVKKLPYVDEVIVGRHTADKYHILGETDFDIVAMGFDQQPPDDKVRQELDERGKHRVEIVRLKPRQQ